MTDSVIPFRPADASDEIDQLTSRVEHLEALVVMQQNYITDIELRLEELEALQR